MPRRTDIKNILVIGSGPIVIGQACEFDYAGTQACKALKEEGFRIVLVNSNPATIMTDPAMADATYIEPLTLEVLEAIIAKEKPDALLPTLGGQTALNCTLALAKAGILEKYQVQLIGASIRSIELAESRSLFQSVMKEIGLEIPMAFKVHNLDEAKAVLEKMPLPAVIRASFTLGGSGAGIAKTQEEYLTLCEQAFAASPTQEVMIDEGLMGWKEFELEVVRDRKDNCIVVCGVENIDPLGIHTGDSITVAPIQTLTDKEYQNMRQAAFSVLRAIGVDTGGSNVQFAVHPQTGRQVVIEMNPRVSRSSALVSKASGFPIAKIAAKLAVGYTLDELQNDHGNHLPASFEPTLDYVVVKIPRFNFEKFPECSSNRGPMMYSVGEVMSIGRTFNEALQKALRSLEIKQNGFGDLYANASLEELHTALTDAGPLQLWAVAEGFRRNLINPIEMHDITRIDPWFLNEILNLIQMEKALIGQKIENLTAQQLKQYKRAGFSDARLAVLLQCAPKQVAQLRQDFSIKPVYKRVDSCAAEFETHTAYFYSTYEQYCEAKPTDRKKVMIIGSGPNRIGQGIEFDYCCVQAVIALKKLGYETIMANCNPETVSTDYDVVDRLYATPLTLEDILAIIEIEKPMGVFIQFGGQTPLLLAEGLAANQVPLLGVDMATVHQTEERQQFRTLLQTLSLQQPKNTTVDSLAEGLDAAKKLGFPLIVRPSFVLGGSAMTVVNNTEQLEKSLNHIFFDKEQHGVLLEQFLQNALEIDVDVISDGEDIFIPGLLEHVENAGIHSGDSACITPAVHLSLLQQRVLIAQARKIARHLKIRGVFNIQFLVQGDEIYVLEVNPRVSRTVPFLCKATGLALVQMAIECILGKSLKEQSIRLAVPNLPYYCVKEAVLPFARFSKSPPILGPEMKSTGEVMGIGRTPEEAYAKAQLAAGNILPKPGDAWLAADADLMDALVPIAKKLLNLGFKLFSNVESVALFKQHNVDVIDYPSSGAARHLVLVIALTSITQQNREIIQMAHYSVARNICHVTTLAAARSLAEALEFHLREESYMYRPLQAHYQEIKKLVKPQHCLTGEEFTSEIIGQLLNAALKLKRKRGVYALKNDLKGSNLALLFDKPSLRTRFSFTIAMKELGGDVIESIGNSRKTETPEDYIRVLEGYCDAIMIRTYADEFVAHMTKIAKIPIVNGLTDLHHPCQIFADLLTLLECFGFLQGLTLTYIGDGNNILHSLLLLAPQMGVDIHYCCPESRQPNAQILQRATARFSEKIKKFTDPTTAVANADAIYTDVWTSMGFEQQRADDLFNGLQINEELMQHAKSHAVFMHCMPMERGKEVSETLPDQACSVVFQQSENRLHVQKALLLYLIKGDLL